MLKLMDKLASLINPYNLITLIVLLLFVVGCIQGRNADAENLGLPESSDIGEAVTARFDLLVLVNGKTQHATAIFASGTPEFDINTYMNGVWQEAADETTQPATLSGGVVYQEYSYTPPLPGDLIIAVSQTVDNDVLLEKGSVRIGETDKIQGYLEQDFIEIVQVAEQSVQSSSWAILLKGYSATPYTGEFAIIANRGSTDGSNFSTRAYDYGDVDGAVGSIQYVTTIVGIAGVTVEEHFWQINVLEAGTAGNYAMSFFQKKTNANRPHHQSIGNFYHAALQEIDTTEIERLVALTVSGASSSHFSIRSSAEISKTNGAIYGLADDIYVPSGYPAFVTTRYTDDDGNVTEGDFLVEYFNETTIPTSLIENVTRQIDGLGDVVTAFPALAGNIEQVTFGFWE